MTFLMHAINPPREYGSERASTEDEEGGNEGGAASASPLQQTPTRPAESGQQADDGVGQDDGGQRQRLGTLDTQVPIVSTTLEFAKEVLWRVDVSILDQSSARHII